jgi:hypothetical protein
MSLILRLPSAGCHVEESDRSLFGLKIGVLRLVICSDKETLDAIEM